MHGITHEFAQAAPDFPHDRRQAWAWLGQRGLFAGAMPRDGGGRGAAWAAAAFEGLGLGGVSPGWLLAANAHSWGTCLALSKHGREEQRRRWLPELLAGRLVGAHAVSEPDAGSDVHAMSAKLSGGRLVGSKTWCTNAPDADLLVVYAREGDALSAVLLPTDRPGVRIEELPKLGLQGARMGGIELDVEVAEADRLGPPGAGFAQFEAVIEWERALIMAGFVGAMQRQLDEAVRHARRRRQFGRPVGTFQAVSHRLVEMKLRVEAARLLVQRAAAAKDRGRAPVEAAEAKLFASEAYLANSLDALRTAGAAGYQLDADVAHHLRDSAGSVLFSGTSDLQREVVAGMLGLRAR